MEPELLHVEPPTEKKKKKKRGRTFHKVLNINKMEQSSKQNTLSMSGKCSDIYTYMRHEEILRIKQGK